jgi:hypothetical protein
MTEIIAGAFVERPIDITYAAAHRKLVDLGNCFSDNTPERARALCNDIIGLMGIVSALDAARAPDDPCAERLFKPCAA